VLIAALLSSAVGTAAMWFVGTRLGLSTIEGLSATTTTDVVVGRPAQGGVPGMFLMWAAASAFVVTVLALSDWISEVRAARRGHSRELASGDPGEVRGASPNVEAALSAANVDDVVVLRTDVDHRRKGALLPDRRDAAHDVPRQPLGIRGVGHAALRPLRA